jgi:thiol-disulfide isomerase/thioredoxin
MGQIERLLPIVAQWGQWAFGAALLASVLGIARLGRDRRFLVPARWPARTASLLLVGLVLACGMGLFAVLGPLRPMLAQVRSVSGVVNHPAQELVFQAVADDAAHRLSDLRGQVVVLNLWATWCGPCLRELPGMNRISRDYASRGLVVVTLSTEERDHLLAFAEKHPLSTLNVYASRTGWLDVSGRPLTLVIDRQGVVREVLIGARSYEELERSVQPWIDKPI